MNFPLLMYVTAGVYKMFSPETQLTEGNVNIILQVCLLHWDCIDRGLPVKIIKKEAM